MGLNTEGREARVSAAAKKRVAERELERTWQEIASAPEPCKLSEEEVRALPLSWHELPGHPNDLLEVELRRARHEASQIQDRSLCSAMSRLEQELGVSFEEHWRLEADLCNMALEREKFDVLEESSAWIRKHKDLVEWPR